MESGRGEYTHLSTGVMCKLDVSKILGSGSDNSGLNFSLLTLTCKVTSVMIVGQLLFNKYRGCSSSCHQLWQLWQLLSACPVSRRDEAGYTHAVTLLSPAFYLLPGQSYDKASVLVNLGTFNTWLQGIFCL